MDFELDFDLSDGSTISNKAKVYISEQLAESKPTVVVKQINRISELTLDQKIKINNILWYNKFLSDEHLKQLLMEDFGLKDVIADNLAYRHRMAYRQDPGFFTIFERNSVESANMKSIAMAERHEMRKATAKRKPIAVNLRGL